MSDLKPLPEQSEAMRPGRHQGVSAGAGSGKTRVLTGRIVTILKAVPPERRTAMLGRIVAVTFTKDAAGEIRSRVRQEFFRELESAAGPADRRSWLELIEALPSVRISTLHGLASRLLRQIALEGGVDPSFTLDERPGTNERISPAAFLSELLDPVRRTKLHTVEAVRAIRELMDRWEARRIGEILAAMDRERELFEGWALGGGRNPGSRSAVKEPGQYRYRASRERLHRALLAPGPFRDELLRLSGEALKIIPDKSRYSGRSSTKVWKYGLPFAQALHRFLTETDGDGHLFGQLVETNLAAEGIDEVDEKYCPDEGDRLVLNRLFREGRGWIDPAAAPKVPEWPEWFTEQYGAGKEQAALDSLYESDLERFRLVAAAWIRWRRNLGAGVSRLDFSDLEVEFERLLRGNPGACRQIGRGIQHLLVDEFQDTSPLQWDFLKLLIESLEPDADVFLVGDEKQSIYFFRRADVTVFGRAVDDLHSHNLSRKGLSDGVKTKGELAKSFRAKRNLLRSVNRIFELAFPDAAGAADFEARRQSLEPVEGSTEPGGYVEWIGDPRKAGTKNGPELKAAQLSALVRRLSAVQSAGLGAEPPVPWSRCAVLCLSHQQLQAVEAALLEAGIPCRRRAEKGFYEADETVAMVQALSLLSVPADGASLLGFFRSPFAALSLNVPFAMSCGAPAGGRPPVPARRWDRWMLELDRSGNSAGLDEVCTLLETRNCGEDARRLRDLVRAVGEARSVLRTRGAAAALARLLETTDGWAAFGTGPGGPGRLANVRKFVDLVRTRESEGLDLPSLVHEFRRYVELGKKAEEPSAPWGDAGDRVSLLTVHGAKGLEFDAVFLPFCGEDPGGRNSDSVHWESLGSGPRPVFRVPPGAGEDGIEPSSWEAADWEKEARAAAEELRVFYVATTRARRVLVMISAGHGGVVPHLRQAFGFLPEAVSGSREIPSGNETASVLLTPLVSLSPGAPAAKPPALETVRARLAEVAGAAASDPFPPPPAARRRIVLDFTSVSTFLSCPLQYYYRHVLEVPQHRWFVEPGGGREAGDRLPAMVRGTLLHKALELGRVDDDYAAWVRFTLESEGISDPGAVLKEVVHAAEAAVRFQEKQLVPLLRTAKSVEREQGFLIRYQEQNGFDIDLRGAIDLAFETDSGWTILDYKSGRSGGPGAAPQKIREERYDLQLAFYRTALEQTGRPVTRTAVAWIDDGFITDVTDPPGPDKVAEVIHRCAEAIAGDRFPGAYSLAGGGGVRPPVCEECGYRVHGLCREFSRDG